MRDYRVFVIGPDGRIIDRFEFWCADHEAAKGKAKQYVDGHDIEVWHRCEKIAQLKHNE